MDIRPEFENPLLGKTLTTTRVIWAALMGSVVLYGIVAAVIVGNRESSEVELMMLVVIYAMGLTSLGMSVGWRALMLSDGRLIGQSPAPSEDDDKPGAVAAFIPQNAAERRLKTAIQRYFVAALVGWALAESVALYGFVLTFLSANFAHLIALGAVALVTMFVQRPSAEFLKNVSRRISTSMQAG